MLPELRVVPHDQFGPLPGCCRKRRIRLYRIGLHRGANRIAEEALIAFLFGAREDRAPSTLPPLRPLWGVCLVVCILKLLPKMFPPLSELRVVPHDHPGPFVTEDFGGLSDPRAGLQQIGRNRVPVQVGDQVAAQLELLSDAPEPAADRVSVPGLAISIQEERPDGTDRHEPLGRILAGFPCTTMPGTWGETRLSYLRCPVSMSDALLVLRAFALRPLGRLDRGAIFGPLVW